VDPGEPVGYLVNDLLFTQPNMFRACTRIEVRVDLHRSCIEM
jgi:hypothetical protein